MHLSSLTLTNVRQFDRRTFEFKPGFNVLVGENGAGKTTVLRGLLATLGGTQQSGRIHKLEDEDIRLRARHAEVTAKVHSSIHLIKEFHFRKMLWERSERSPSRKGLPLVLFYASNEATCSAMNVKKAKRTGDSKLDEFLKLSEHELLDHAGKISAEQAKTKAEMEYSKYRALLDALPRAVDLDFEKAVQALKKLPTPKKKKP